MEIDWERLSAGLDERGSAVVEHLLSPAQCRALARSTTRTIFSAAA